MNRRNFLSMAAAAAAVGSFPSFASSALPQVDVYKNPQCGCCGDWVDHLKAAGFQVKVHEIPDTTAIRRSHGIPDEFSSCHTALVAGYALEGHVPADDVKRLLAKKPLAAGLSVPGMPAGAPGMEMGSRKDPFQVLLIDKVGRSSVVASYPKT